MENEKIFYKYIRMLATQCNTVVEQERINFYLKKLSKFDLSEIIKALDTLLESETVFPTVKRIKEEIEGKGNDSQKLAEIIAGRTWNAVMSLKGNVNKENYPLYLNKIGDIDLKCFENKTHFNSVINQIVEQKITLRQLYTLMLSKTEFFSAEEITSIYDDIKNERQYVPKEIEIPSQPSQELGSRKHDENGERINLLVGFLEELV